MILRTAKRLAERLPEGVQRELKRFRYRRQVRMARRGIEEPEDSLLRRLLAAGDWVIDVGANVGHYTVRFSELVGGDGRVIAFEPVPATFEFLASHAAQSWPNVTAINAAATESFGTAGMCVPRTEFGTRNYYCARITTRAHEFAVLCLPVDALGIDQPVRLAKIDAEGHELGVLRGMHALLNRDHPFLIVEDNSPSVSDFLADFGYSSSRLRGSCNRFFYATIEPPEIVADLLEPERVAL